MDHTLFLLYTPRPPKASVFHRRAPGVSVKVRRYGYWSWFTVLGGRIFVIPAQAGIQEAPVISWTPAFATVAESALYGPVRNCQDVFHARRPIRSLLLVAAAGEGSELRSKPFMPRYRCRRICRSRRRCLSCVARSLARLYQSSDLLIRKGPVVEARVVKLAFEEFGTFVRRLRRRFFRFRYI